jgi:hypothetical protein
MPKQLTLLCLVLFLISCHTIGRKSEISIHNKTLEPQYMSYIDKYGERKSVLVNYKTPLSIKEHFPKLVSTQFEYIERPVFIRSKDRSIHVVMRGDSISYEGNKKNEELVVLQEMHRRFSLFNGYTLGLYKRAKDLNYAYLSSKEVHREQMALLNNFYKKYKINRDLQKRLNEEIKYSYICNLLGPYSIKGVNVDSLSPAFVKTLEALNKDIRNAIKTRKGTGQNVYAMVYDYNRFLSRKDMEGEKAFETQWLKAEKKFKKETKEYIQFKLLKEYYGSLVQYDSYWQLFKKKCKDKDFVHHLEAFFQDNKYTFSDIERQSELIDSSGKSYTWEQILAQNKGKKAYINIVSHFMLQYNIANLEDIADKIEQKNCQIILISDDNKMQDWLKAYPKDAPQNIQFYRLKDLESPLAQYFRKMNIISRFSNSCLLNTNGQIIFKKLSEPTKASVFLKQLDFEGLY